MPVQSEQRETGIRTVALYCARSSNQQCPLSVAAGQGTFDGIGCVVCCQQLQDFGLALASADCGIVTIPQLQEAEFDGLVAMRRDAPETPIVLVTSKDFRNAEAALELGVDHLVWLGDVQRKLRTAINHASERSFLLTVAHNAQLANDLPATMRDTISACCRSRRPLRSLQQVADITRRSRATIWRAWMHNAPQDLTLKAFQDWVLLLHAAARRGSADNWEGVAEQLGVDEGTLARLVRRCLDAQLSEVGRHSLHAVRGEFCSRVLATLGIRAPRNRMR